MSHSCTSEIIVLLNHCLVFFEFAPPAGCEVGAQGQGGLGLQLRTALGSRVPTLVAEREGRAHLDAG